jgi:hypothetical protein
MFLNRRMWERTVGLALGRSGGQAPDEVALQGEEAQQGDSHVDEGPRGDYLPLFTAPAHQSRDSSSENDNILARPRKTSATNKSFHTHRNRKMAKEAMTGTERGSTNRVKVVSGEASPVEQPMAPRSIPAIQQVPLRHPQTSLARMGGKVKSRLESR